jgi:hypothetical protein
MKDRKPSHNSTYKKLAVQCYAESFVVSESFVLRINICGKNRQLLLAVFRYRQIKELAENQENRQIKLLIFLNSLFR